MCNSGKTAAILCLGEDGGLLGTRYLLIKQLCPCVETSTTVELQSFMGREFNIFVLCHSLTQEHRKQCLRIIHERWVSAKVASVHINAHNLIVGPEPILSNRPAAFVQGMEQLLKQTRPVA